VLGRAAHWTFRAKSSGDQGLASTLVGNSRREGVIEPPLFITEYGSGKFPSRGDVANLALEGPELNFLHLFAATASRG
jgi:hypothetical protein